jgi:hypothetical protein
VRQGTDSATQLAYRQACFNHASSQCSRPILPSNTSKKASGSHPQPLHHLLRHRSPGYNLHVFGIREPPRPRPIFSPAALEDAPYLGRYTRQITRGHPCHSLVKYGVPIFFCALRAHLRQTEGSSHFTGLKQGPDSPVRNPARAIAWCQASSQAQLGNQMCRWCVHNHLHSCLVPHPMAVLGRKRM